MKKLLALFALLVFASSMMPASAHGVSANREYSYRQSYFAPLPPPRRMNMTPVRHTTVYYSPMYVSHTPPPPPSHRHSRHRSNAKAAVAGGVLAGLVAGGIVAAILN